MSSSPTPSSSSPASPSPASPSPASPSPASPSPASPSPGPTPAPAAVGPDDIHDHSGYRDGRDHLEWSYRLMLTDHGHVEIREVYRYPDGCIAGWTPGPTTLWGIDEADLRAGIPAKLEALNHPVLVEVELDGYEAEGRPVDKLGCTGSALGSRPS